jgi:small subunit ribosomal protein S20
MANHFSALKRARQTEKRTAQNRAIRSRVRTALRSLRTSLASKDSQAAGTNFNSAASELDKAVRKGVLHKNTASRYKSRLSARLKALSK